MVDKSQRSAAVVGWFREPFKGRGLMSLAGRQGFGPAGDERSELPRDPETGRAAND
jgi:hypothetical protein